MSRTDDVAHCPWPPVLTASLERHDGVAVATSSITFRDLVGKILKTEAVPDHAHDITAFLAPGPDRRTIEV